MHKHMEVIQKCRYSHTKKDLKTFSPQRQPKIKCWHPVLLVHMHRYRHAFEIQGCREKKEKKINSS